MSDRSNTGFLIGTAMSGAALIMAYQVAGKAARDALFLSNFRAAQLPSMVMAGATIAILLGLLNARLLTVFTPLRLVPTLMVTSGLLQAVEWVTYQSFPQWTSVAVYAHIVSLGAVITSGFWSVINEQMDPYTAKQTFGQIAAAGTAGGVIGGFVAERLAAITTSESVLLFLCGAQVATGILLSFLPRTNTAPARTHIRARDVIRKSAYLWNLTLLVVIGTFSAALLDYVLKSEARRAIGPGEPLLRFFALFHTSTALLSFLVQAALTQRYLHRWGLGATIGTLPGAVAGGSLVAAFTGGLPAVVIARGLEAVLRGSLFRAGYELFYTPMVPAEKRALKSINDVTVDRLGDGFGGGFSQVVIMLAGRGANPILLITAAITSAAGWLVAQRLNQAYIKSLERSLRHRARDLDLPEEEEGADLAMVESFDTRPLAPALEKLRPPQDADWLPVPLRHRWQDLTSGDRERAKNALVHGPPIQRLLLPYVIPLLGRRSVTEYAGRALEAVAEKNVGQLSDYLLDAQTPLAVRARLPVILGGTGSARALDALIRGLRDESTEVRTQCGRALDTLQQTTDIQLDPQRVYDTIRQELEVLLDPRRLATSSNAHDIEHVFALLGVVLPREAVRISFEALRSEDTQLKGLAFEYLESALPPDIGVALSSIVHREEQPEICRPAIVVHQELLSLIGQLRQERTGQKTPKQT